MKIDIKTQQYHKLKYINWSRDATIVKVNHQQWNDLIDTLKPEQQVNIGAQRKTVRKYWFNGSWSVVNGKSSLIQCLVAKDDQYYIYSTFRDPNKNTGMSVTGYKAYQEVNETFKTFSNQISLIKAFGVLPKEWNFERQCCKSCTNVVWHNKQQSYVKHALGGYKADLSSCFPRHLLGKLPDAHTRIVVDKVVEPDEEYEFAFYDNGDVCIYGEVDTRQARYHDHLLLKEKNSYNEVRWTQEPTKTVLMKRSAYQLNSAIISIYSKKENKALKNREYYKGVLNSFIGFTYSTNSTTLNSSTFMPHIAATALARYIKQIVDIFDTLVSEGNKPLQLLTDSVMWIGGPSATATDTKMLGAFVYEAKNYKCVSIAGGQYAMESQDGTDFFCKHQGLDIKQELADKNINTINKFIKFMEKCNTFEKAVADYYNEKTFKFERKEVLKYDF